MPRYQGRIVVVEQCFLADAQRGEMWFKMSTDSYKNYNISPMPEELLND